MNSIKAVVCQGRIDLTVPVEWTDGTEVEIHPISGKLSEELHSLSQEEIEKLLATMDKLKPLELSDDEREQWEAERLATKAKEKSDFLNRAEILRRQWE